MKYLIDLDGTLMNGKHANLDSVRFIRELQEQKLGFAVMTNSIKDPVLISERLAAAGMHIPSSRILNPIRAINGWLKAEGITHVFIVGSGAETAQVDAAHEADDPEAIVLLDFEKNNIDYNGLQHIFSLMLRNIPAVSASPSVYYLKDGKKQLDTGAFAALLEAASARKIPVMGKPSPEYFGSAAAFLETEAAAVTVIGDDWSTDVAGAKKAGCRAVLVRSGKYIPGDEEKCTPDLVTDRLTDIVGVPEKR